MKTNYAAPVVTLRGEVVLNTKLTIGGAEVPNGAPASAGSVGFNL